MFVNKPNMAGSTPCSPVNSIHPDLLQLSQTIQQVSSQLNLILSQQQQLAPQKCSDGQAKEHFTDLSTSTYSDQPLRPCHHTSSMNFIKSASGNILMAQCHHRPTTLSSSTSSSLLSSTYPSSCPHDPALWHQKYHHQHYHHYHPCLSPDPTRPYPCVHHSITCQEQQQQQQQQQYQQQHSHQHSSIDNNIDPGSINTTPPTDIMPSDPDPPSSVASPAPTFRSDTSCDEINEPVELTWTDIYQHQEEINTLPKLATITEKKKKINQSFLLRDWWSHKWHRLRNKSVSPSY
ncbi:hypothetical protein BC941DRAFT_428199 [Chlamydoabsidia padenii]|nr:hypothetical protein BC941DRAFT_428199 [Chlamydoabsidia padenii]